MDTNTLVTSGHSIVEAMDRANISPKLAMWVHNEESETWKLWLLPQSINVKIDAQNFYRKMSVLISENRPNLGGIDISDLELIPPKHPVIEGMKRFIRAEGLNSIHLSGNTYNGFYLPDGILLRSTL